MRYWKAHYRDEFHDEDILIANEEADKYRLKCCFTCQWSDYSPYGSDDFGTMLCYRAHKEEYLRVNTKNDYFEHLEGLPVEQRQETYICPDFAVRDQCEGYRGFVEE